MAAKKTIKKTTDKDVAVKSARKDKVTKDISELSSEKIASSIAKSSVDISKQLASINETAQEEIAKLNTIREAISFKQEELEEIHGKEAVLKLIDELQLAAENSRIEFEAEAEERREAWRKEQISHSQSVQDRDLALAKQRQQEQEEYTYNLELEHKKADNEWNEQVYNRKIGEQRRLEILNHEWKEKGEALDAREKAIAEKEQLIATFDDRIREAEEAATAKAKKSVYAELSVKESLARKDYESSQALLEQNVRTLESTVSKYEAQIAELEKQNSSSRDKIQSMAEAALSASSGRDALRAVQETVEKGGSSKR